MKGPSIKILPTIKGTIKALGRNQTWIIQDAINPFCLIKILFQGRKEFRSENWCISLLEMNENCERLAFNRMRKEQFFCGVFCKMLIELLHWKETQIDLTWKKYWWGWTLAKSECNMSMIYLLYIHIVNICSWNYFLPLRLFLAFFEIQVLNNFRQVSNLLGEKPPETSWDAFLLS